MCLMRKFSCLCTVLSDIKEELVLKIRESKGYTCLIDEVTGCTELIDPHKIL